MSVALALVLMSTFSSVVALASHLYRLPARFVTDPFDSAEVLRHKPARALHLHGRRDELVPFAQAEALAAITGGPLLAEEGGHNDCPLDWRAFVERVVDYVGPAAVPPAAEPT